MIASQSWDRAYKWEQRYEAILYLFQVSRNLFLNYHDTSLENGLIFWTSMWPGLETIACTTRFFSYVITYTSLTIYIVGHHCVYKMCLHQHISWLAFYTLQFCIVLYMLFAYVVDIIAYTITDFVNAQFVHLFFVIPCFLKWCLLWQSLCTRK